MDDFDAEPGDGLQVLAALVLEDVESGFAFCASRYGAVAFSSCTWSVTELKRVVAFSPRFPTYATPTADEHCPRTSRIAPMVVTSKAAPYAVRRKVVLIR
jgi:hypothetical protein